MPLESGKRPRKATLSKNRIKSFFRNFQFSWRLRNYLHEVVYAARRETMFRDEERRTSIEPGGPAHEWAMTCYDDLLVLLKKDGVIPVLATQASLVDADTVKDPACRALMYPEYLRMTFDEMLAQWNALSDIIEESARRNKVVFMDVRSEVPSDLDHFLDHVHLTERGNARVAKSLFQCIVETDAIDSLLWQLDTP